MLLGKNVACDAFDETKPVRVVTHAHADHIVGLRQSLRTSERVLMTPATKDLINVLKGPQHLMHGCVETVDYGRTLQYGEEQITLLKSDHILGSAQVLIEDAEGQRMVYTGDFKIDETPVICADILVTESTYGSPSCKRRFHGNIKEQLVGFVEKNLKHRPVHIFGYHGKLQEVMQILHTAGIRVTQIASGKVFQVSKVGEKHGMRIGQLRSSEEPETRELLEKNEPCLVYHHMNNRSEVAEGSLHITISGWEFSSAIRKTGDNEYTVALSDHSDYDGLMEYVRCSKPELVITDNFRDGHAMTFAKEVTAKLGIPAAALPRE